MSQLILGFAGRKQAGKDSCGNLLKEKQHDFFAHLPVVNGQRVAKYSFADPLKQFCMEWFGLTWEQCYGTDTEKNSLTKYRWEDLPHYQEVVDNGWRHDGSVPKGPMTARHLMQEVGTGILRRMYRTIHVDKLLTTIKAEGYPVAIICDARFPDEVEGVQQVGGKVVRLTRNIYGTTPFRASYRGATLDVVLGGNDVHVSELALDPDKFDWNKFDSVIHNHDLTISEQNICLKATLIDWGWVKVGKAAAA